MKRYRKTLGIAALAFACLGIATAQATPTDRIIIKVSETMRPAVLADGGPTPRARERLAALSTVVGQDVSWQRAMSGGADVVRLPRTMPLEQVQAMAAAMAALPGVDYAEPDVRLFPLQVPDDPLYAQQWHLKPVGAGTYGIDAEGAWGLSVGDAVTVAVVDTGIRFLHPDLVGKVLPGYDFVDEDPEGVFFTANDGDGRDGNATDPGDWITASEAEALSEFGCREARSSWHGTHVAGVIAAATDNAQGVAGISRGAMILPVRGLGKCGGYTSDIADGIRWAAGVPDAALPANPHPARIINLSLGGGSCAMTLQNAIHAANGRDALVVAAAGNTGDTDSPAPVAPGSCGGVLTVAASKQDGTRAAYSSYGTAVDITAPGNEILATAGLGDDYPTGHGYGFKSGTSMSAPMVSGVAALLLSRNPGLNRQTLFERIVDNVTAFPVGFDCPGVDACGSGLLNAALALGATADPGGRPTPLAFASVEGVEANVLQVSTDVVVDSAGTLDLSVEGGEYSIGCNGVFTAVDGSIENGEDLCLRHLSAPRPEHPAATVVRLGNHRSAFVSLTGFSDTQPESFSFAPQDQTGVSETVISSSVAMEGIDAPAPVMVSGGEYSLGCGISGFTTEPGYVAPGGTICVRHQAASSFATRTVTTLTVGGVSADFASTTRTGGGGGGSLSPGLLLLGLIYPWLRRVRRHRVASSRPVRAP